MGIIQSKSKQTLTRGELSAIKTKENNESYVYNEKLQNIHKLIDEAVEKGNNDIWVSKTDCPAFVLKQLNHEKYTAYPVESGSIKIEW